jgi:hypothetical protein
MQAIYKKIARIEKKITGKENIVISLGDSVLMFRNENALIKTWTEAVESEVKYVIKVKL